MTRNLILINFIVMYKTTAYSQSIMVQSLEDAIALAFKKNPDYQNFILNQEQAQIEYKQSKSYRIPSITGSFSGQRNFELATTPVPAEIVGGPPGETINTQFGQDYAYNVGFSIRTDLFNRELTLKSKLSKLNTQVVQVEKEKYEEFLEQSVSLYYYTALVAKKAVEVAEKDLESASQVSALTKEKYDQGLLELIVFNQSRINENLVKQNLSSNKQLLDECLIELKKLLGVSLKDELVLSENPDYTLPQVFSEEQLETDLRVKDANLRLNQADMNIKLSRSAMLPSLSLNAYLGQQQFRDDFGLAFDGDSWSSYRYLTLNLSIPVFTGLNNRRNVHKNKINHQIAQNEKVEAELTSQLEDQLLIKSYQSSLAEASLAKDNFLLYSENQKLTYDKYQEGIISLDNYLSVFEDYVKAENAYLNSLSKVYSIYSQIIPRI